MLNVVHKNTEDVKSELKTMRQLPSETVTEPTRIKDNSKIRWCFGNAAIIRPQEQPWDETKNKQLYKCRNQQKERKKHLMCENRLTILRTTTTAHI